MMTPDGKLTMLATNNLDEAQRQADDAGAVLMFGREEQLHELASSVKIGAAEKDRRRNRRRQQRDSRRRNRS